MTSSRSLVSGPTSQITVIGAGNVGSTLAQRVVERSLANVVLVDVVEGRPQGIALDLMEAAGAEGHSATVLGTNNYADTAHSDVIVVTAGLPRKPGMSRDDLAPVNGAIVLDTLAQALPHSPDALVVVVTNPLDAMTYLAWKGTGLPCQRVMGMAGTLDSCRFQTFIALELGVPPRDVSALVLGGHGDLMVPLPQYSTVNGVPITELLPTATIDRLIQRTRHGGAEIVQLLKRGGAYYAPASAVCVMLEAILYHQRRLLPVAAYVDGPYGLRDVYVGVPVRLGRQGVESVLTLELTPDQQAALIQSGEAVRRTVQRAGELLP